MSISMSWCWGAGVIIRFKGVQESLNSLCEKRYVFCPCCLCRIETTENPFALNGELRRKADDILRHSRILRTDLHIVDPDCAVTLEDASRSQEKIGVDPEDDVVQNGDEELVAVVAQTTANLMENSQAALALPAREELLSSPADQDRHTDLENGKFTGANGKSSMHHRQQPQETMDDGRRDDLNEKQCLIELNINSQSAVVDNVWSTISPECQKAEYVKLANGKRCRCCRIQWKNQQVYVEFVIKKKI